jgi:hypothetical protein
MTHAEATTDEEVARLRKAYLEEVLPALNDASERVHQALDDAARALMVVRDHLLAGGQVSDFESFIDPKPLRASLSASLGDLEHVRHLGQRTLFRLLQAEGKSISDIARMWGISRQLASRILHEAD